MVSWWLLLLHIGGVLAHPGGAKFFPPTVKINADGDEKMTWEEWCTAVGADAAKDGLTAAMATPEGRAEFKKVFESLDANGDGALSSKEWGQGIGKKWHEDDAFKELSRSEAASASAEAQAGADGGGATKPKRSGQGTSGATEGIPIGLVRVATLDGLVDQMVSGRDVDLSEAVVVGSRAALRLSQKL